MKFAKGCKILKGRRGQCDENRNIKGDHCKFLKNGYSRKLKMAIKFCKRRRRQYDAKHKGGTIVNSQQWLGRNFKMAAKF